MNYLLDTHTAIWLLEDDNQLSLNALKAIENFSTNCFIFNCVFVGNDYNGTVRKVAIASRF